MAVTLHGPNVLFGVVERKPLVGFPEGRTYVSMMPSEWVTVTVVNGRRVRKWTVVEAEGMFGWEPFVLMSDEDLPWGVRTWRIVRNWMMGIYEQKIRTKKTQGSDREAGAAVRGESEVSDQAAVQTDVPDRNRRGDENLMGGERTTRNDQSGEGQELYHFPADGIVTTEAFDELAQRLTSLPTVWGLEDGGLEAVQVGEVPQREGEGDLARVGNTMGGITFSHRTRDNHLSSRVATMSTTAMYHSEFLDPARMNPEWRPPSPLETPASTDGESIGEADKEAARWHQGPRRRLLDMEGEA